MEVSATSERCHPKKRCRDGCRRLGKLPELKCGNPGLRGAQLVGGWVSNRKVQQTHRKNGGFMGKS